MTTIKATCPTCGEVGLTPDEVQLHVDSADTASSFYAFECPSCLETIRKPADERVIRLLMSGGVEVVQLWPQPRPRRLYERFDHPALTHDDLLDFHAMLQGDAWFGELQQLTGRQDAA